MERQVSQPERERDAFHRTSLLLGEDAMERLAHSRVAILGVGGVGSWCAEAMARSGVGHMTLIDPDRIDPTNINRQLHATSSTLGRAKVDAMRERLLDINPRAEVEALSARYTAETADNFRLWDYDFVVDAIDSQADKAHLILYVTLLTSRQGSPRMASSMGAARRTDPTRVRVSEFWQVNGDPLASSLRKRMRREGTLPHCPFPCVFSTEPPLPPNRTHTTPGAGTPVGSLCQVTATFGMTLASQALSACLGGVEDYERTYHARYPTAASEQEDYGERAAAPVAHGKGREQKA